MEGGVLELWSLLRSWAEMHGATIAPHLEPNNCGGLQCQEGAELAGASMLLEVPRALWIEITMVPGGDWASAELCLARALAREKSKGATSFWAPYIETLPHEPASALRLTPRDCQLLPFGVRESANTLIQRAEQFAASSEIHPELLYWALGCVWSRAFRVKVAEDSEVAALIPLADAFNHADDSQAALMIKGFDGYDFYVGTQSSLPSDISEVCICYRVGATIASLLLQYGFCSEENQHAEALVQVDGLLILFMTKGASNSLACDSIIRLQDSEQDWENALLDRDADAEPTVEEKLNWEAVLNELVTRGLVTGKEEALEKIAVAVNSADKHLVSHDNEPMVSERGASVTDHANCLREHTHLLLRLAFGRVPWLSRDSGTV